MGETRTVRGCCPLDCQDTCAWVAEVEDGRVTGVRGDREHPFTRGALCAKVNDYEARTYDPGRLLHPLRRTGAKGSGAFERVTWEAALDEIAERFRAIVDESGPAALAYQRYAGSMGAVQTFALERLFHALGASRQVGHICGGLIWEGLADMRLDGPNDPEDVAEARLVLVWGANPLSTAHHIWHFIQEARKRHGARVVVIDPRRTRSARAADEWLPIRIGSDVALALALGRTILEEGLEDSTFLAERAEGLEAYRRAAEPWTPERAAETCGIPAGRIRELARELAAARPAAIKTGVNFGAHSAGRETIRSVAALGVLCGHWGLPGGGVFAQSGPATNGRRASGIDRASPPGRPLHIGRLGETLTDAGLDPPVRGLMVWGTNPVVVLPDAERVRRGLLREDLFTVVLEHFPTDTARLADLVLPSTTQLEHFDVHGSWGHHYVTLNRPAIEPRGESRNHGWVARELARRLGLPEDSDEAIARDYLPDSVTLEELAERHWIKVERGRAAPDGVRLDFEPRLPPGPTGSFPLTLISPKSHHTLNSSFMNQARQRAAEGRPTLEMSPADAGTRGLVDQAPVRVFNELGELHAWLRVTDDLVPGLVSLPGRWWREQMAAGVTNNVLVPGRFSGESGQPAYNECFVEVAPAATGE